MPRFPHYYDKTTESHPLVTRGCTVKERRPGGIHIPAHSGTVKPLAASDSAGNRLPVKRIADGAAGITVDALIEDKEGRGSLTCAGVVNLLNPANRYTGATIVVTGALLRVSFLDDGDRPSPIGASSTASRNLIISGTFEYHGVSPASTDRLFTINSATGAAVSNESPDPVSTLAFTNGGGLGLGSVNLSRTLTLAGANTGENILYPSVSDNGAGVTSLHKRGPGCWGLYGYNVHTGGTSVHEGTLVAGHPASLGRGQVVVYEAGTLVSGARTFGVFAGPGLLVINGTLKLDSHYAPIRLVGDSFYIFSGTLDLNGKFDAMPAGEYLIIAGGAGPGRHADNLRAITGYGRSGYSVRFMQGVLIVTRDEAPENERIPLSE